MFWCVRIYYRECIVYSWYINKCVFKRFQVKSWLPCSLVYTLSLLQCTCKCILCSCMVSSGLAPTCRLSLEPAQICDILKGMQASSCYVTTDGNCSVLWCIAMVNRCLYPIGKGFVMFTVGHFGCKTRKCVVAWWDTVFTWLDAAPWIVIALRGPTIDCGNNGLRTVFPYRMVVEFEQSPHWFWD